jgi:hypothetical protein
MARRPSAVDLGRHGLEVGARARGQRDIGPGLRQRQRRGAPYALAGAGDDGHLALDGKQRGERSASSLQCGTRRISGA